jgi:hypothetical protein
MRRIVGNWIGSGDSTQRLPSQTHRSADGRTCTPAAGHEATLSLCSETIVATIQKRKKEGAAFLLAVLSRFSGR